MDLIQKYFPDLTDSQQHCFGQLKSLYDYWNSRINIISRKDIDMLYERHVLHSLGIAKIISFMPGTAVLDVGTGGGFPGIPLAILFPESDFLLVDSIGKKIAVVNEIVKALNLSNVQTMHIRAEQLTQKFDFIVSRAVTEMPEFYKWVKKLFTGKNCNSLPNGILYLKGGDLLEELKPFKNSCKVYRLSKYFEEDFFETKKVVYLPVGV
ncbi:MAG: 16S rRNA (guanine(527)-N(7))-methyltransferase RsmG [Bacteroidia bacterium]|nr:16S rRNA (guanine(527)-N(7))-methyltransferase RsmG [Bacteroidia bacterium]